MTDEDPYTILGYPEFKQAMDSLSIVVEQQDWYNDFKASFCLFGHLLDRPEKKMWWSLVPHLKKTASTNAIHAHQVGKTRPGKEYLWPNLVAAKILFPETWETSAFAERIQQQYPAALLSVPWPNICKHTGRLEDYPPETLEIATEENRRTGTSGESSAARETSMETGDGAVIIKDETGDSTDDESLVGETRTRDAGQTPGPNGPAMEAQTTDIQESTETGERARLETDKKKRKREVLELMKTPLRPSRQAKTIKRLKTKVNKLEEDVQDLKDQLKKVNDANRDMDKGQKETEKRVRDMDQRLEGMEKQTKETDGDLGVVMEAYVALRNYVEEL